MVTGFCFADFQPQVFCSNMSGWRISMMNLCGVSFFFGVRNAMINYKIQALIHESVLFFHGFTVRSLWKLPRWCELVPQPTRCNVNYMTSSPESSRKKIRIPWLRCQIFDLPLTKNPEGFGEGFLLTKDVRCFFFGGNLQGV